MAAVLLEGDLPTELATDEQLVGVGVSHVTTRVGDRHVRILERDKPDGADRAGTKLSAKRIPASRRGFVINDTLPGDIVPESETVPRVDVLCGKYGLHMAPACSNSRR